MSKIFFTVGKVTTQSVSNNQPVWTLLPETRRPVVVPTYARQLSSGSSALFRLGSVWNLFNTQLLPHLRATAGKSIESTERELVSIQKQLDDFAGDVPKRARVFLAYLHAHRLMDRKLYPIAEKLRQNGPLSSKDMTPLVEAVYTTLRRTADAKSSQGLNKQSCLNFDASRRSRCGTNRSAKHSTTTFASIRIRCSISTISLSTESKHYSATSWNSSGRCSRITSSAAKVPW
jgi:hypothetical protein